MRFLLALLAALLGPVAAQARPGDFARAAYATPLRDVCPSPFVIQKDWLAQAEHGGLHQLIGGGGRIAPGRHSGPLGSTGVELIILEGGSGIGLGDGETAYSALHLGNTRARLRPHLAMHDLDNAFIFSRRFPATGVVAPLERSPTALFWDRATYPRGFRSITDLKRLERTGAKIYVSTTRRTYARHLVAQGLPRSLFVEGYRGDGETFVSRGGRWLNQGSATNEVYAFTHGRRWGRPIDYVLVSDLGYPIYGSMLAVATPRLQELAPCLRRLVPLIQRAQADYMHNAAEVNDLLFRFNEAGYGAPFWRTSRALLADAVRTQRRIGVVGNGPNRTLGDFDTARVARVLALLRPTLDERARADVRPDDVVTNRFIDHRIGLGAP